MAPGPDGFRMVGYVHLTFFWSFAANGSASAQQPPAASPRLD